MTSDHMTYSTKNNSNRARIWNQLYEAIIQNWGN